MAGFGMGVNPRRRRWSAANRSTPWGDFVVSSGFNESPDNTFTRNSAASWTPRVYSNAGLAGAVKAEGAWLSGNDVVFGLDTNKTVTQPFNCLYAWYFVTSNAGTRAGGTPRNSAGVPLPSDTYGVRKTWNGSAWLIEWYRIRSGSLTVFDSLTTATDETLAVLGGANPDTAGFSLVNVAR